MRVSDNTSKYSVQDALNRTRSKLEDLQLKNATLKKINVPSDDPVANAKIMQVRSQKDVNHQWTQNGHQAKDRIQHTENAIQELSEILMRAKEIALNQSSGPSATKDSRLGVAQEISQLYQQTVAIGNRRIGEQHLFSGFKTLTVPYDMDGQYFGDQGEIRLEIQKGVYTSINIPGEKVFKAKRVNPDLSPEYFLNEEKRMTRNPASVETALPSSEEKMSSPAKEKDMVLEEVDAFEVLRILKTGLLTNDTDTIRNTIDSLDTLIGHSINLRAQLGSRMAGIDSAISSLERTDFQNQQALSQLEDADYAELWSNLAKEETVMRASLQAAQKLIQPTLLDFMR